MNEHITVMAQTGAADAKSKITDRMKSAYQSLLELSELENSQLCDDERKNAEYALEIVLKYGSFQDSAKAIKHFGTYNQLKTMLEI